MDLQGTILSFHHAPRYPGQTGRLGFLIPPHRTYGCPPANLHVCIPEGMKLTTPFIALKSNILIEIVTLRCHRRGNQLLCHGHLICLLVGHSAMG
jgi:hypothetical protein